MTLEQAMELIGWAEWSGDGGYDGIPSCPWCSATLMHYRCVCVTDPGSANHAKPADLHLKSCPAAALMGWPTL